MTIRGPIDKTVFRDHPDDWKNYTDPLPACDIAPEPYDEPQPSVSTIKQAWPKFLGDWIAGETAKAAWRHRSALVDMTEDEAKALLTSASDRLRDSAADRGHAIHSELENLLDGKPAGLSLELNDDAKQYRDCLQLLVDNEEFEVVASEVVVIGEGFGGTFDAVVRLADGRLVGVDYKSRKLGKAATRYAEEGCQLAAYFRRGDYWIFEDADGLHRMKPLEVDGAIVISIAPDGYRVYEVDLDEATRTWDALFSFHEAMQGAAARIFSAPRGASVDTLAFAAARPAPGATEATEPPASPERRQWVHDRIAAVLGQDTAAASTLAGLWPEGVKTLKQHDGHTDAELDAIVKAIVEVEARHQIGFFPPDPTAPSPVRDITPVAESAPAPATIDEGEILPPAERDKLIARRDNLDPPAQQSLDRWAVEGHESDCGFSPRRLCSERRVAIVSAAITLAAWDPDDEAARVALGVVLGQEIQPAFTVGSVLGSLTLDEAKRLGTVARALALGEQTVTFDASGTPTLAA